MNTTKQDLAVTIGLIADISRAFRFDAVKELVNGEPQFTCDLTDVRDPNVEVGRITEFYLTDRMNRSNGKCHIVLRREERPLGALHQLSIYDSCVNEASHQIITRAAYDMIRTLLLDIDLEVGLSWVGR